MSERRSHSLPTRSSWRAMFGVVPDHGIARRPSDVLRAILGTIGFGIGAIGALTYSSWEQTAHEIISAVPRPILSTFRFLNGAGVIIVLLLVLATAVAVRRIRFISVVVVAAVLAGAIWFVMDHLLDVPAIVGAQALGISDFPHYPELRLVVCAAVFFVASPEITRPFRRVLLTFLWLVAIGSVARADGYPSGVIGSILLGWAIAAIVHLIFGSPDGMPDPKELEAGLADAGDHVENLRPSHLQIWGAKAFSGTSTDGPVRVATIGRDAVDGAMLAKFGRWLWYKDSGPMLMVNNQQQIEHRAYMLLLAERHGVHVPSVAWSGRVGARRDAVLVCTVADGPTLDEIDRSTLTDARFDAMWTELAALHSAGISHGGIWAGEFRERGTDGVEFTDLATADAAPDDDAFLLDRVALLVTIAELADGDRAVASAKRSIGPDGIDGLLPLLQATALPRITRRNADGARKLCSDLRSSITAATGTEAPKLEELRRVAPSTVVIVAFTLLGFYLLIGQFAHVEWSAMFTDANWWWLPFVILFAQVPIFALSLSVLGSVSKRLPLRPVILLEFGAKFTGLAGGGVTTIALQVRFFQKQGLAAAVAVTSSLLNSVASGTVEVLLLVVALIIGAGSFDVSNGGGHGGLSGKLLLAAVVVAVVTAIALSIPQLRRRLGGLVMPQIHSAWDNLRNVLRDPRKGALMLGGNLLSQVAYAMVLWAALHVYGHSLDLMQLIVINTFASILGGIAPVPGGIGVIEAGLIGGFTAAGIPDQAAIAATFTARTFTAYLPPIWGWLAISWMRRRDYV